MGAKNSMRGMDAARRAAFVLCCICFVGCCVFLIVWLADGQSVKSRNQQLAEQFHAIGSIGLSGVETAKPPQTEAEAIAHEMQQGMAELRLQNSDTVGWIRIAGTAIDYPIVRHEDNEYYLNRNFWQEKDRYGAIFMDCANIEGFAERHIILYGHNMKDGAMFGGLDQYLYADYLNTHPIIEITLPDGSIVSYRIFAARRAYTDDPSYQVEFADEGKFADFTAALGTSDALQLLTLSTCANGSDTSARIIIHAAPE